MTKAKPKAKRTKGMSFPQVRKMLLAFPGVVEGPCYGTPGFRVGKKFLTRLHQAKDSMVVKVPSIDERDMLLEADPRVFHITEHYRNYPALLVRIANVEPDVLRAMIERNWRAPRRRKPSPPTTRKNEPKKMNKRTRVSPASPCTHTFPHRKASGF